ncbi:serine hydrolase [Gordonia sp. L191]|uniref:serine hydrolase n=1 Tax=Gordonia sp. L191 TaxID=2982699 RepID=UPI0024BF824A|nr:serine hydrolase [Gordonia sp. L191]WHU46111.1 serine hydrolase [Gordonia sp. L191]
MRTLVPGWARLPHSTGSLARTTLALLAAGTLLVACDSGSTSPDASSSSSATQEDPNAQAAVPLPANAVETAVGRLDGLVATLMNSTKIPGMAVAVVEGNNVRYAKGFGVTGEPNGAKVDADTVFQLASVSKSVGSTVIARLITDKVIGWDTPVAANYPGFALADPYVSTNVTIADMYAHRSGLPEHAGDKIEDLGYNQQEIINRLRHIPLAPFRSTYDYTNFGLTAAAVSAANKAGTDWATLSQNMIYAPLGMSRTSSRYADFSTRPNHALGHVKVDGKWVVSPYPREPDAQTPAGGVSSSVNDLTHWLSMLLGSGTTSQGRQIISGDALTPAISPQIVSSPPAEPTDRAGFYGYGFNASITEGGRTQYSHSGAFASGAATNFLVLPSANVGIVVLTNAAPVGAAETLTGEFADLVQFGEVKHDWAGLYGQAFAAMSKPSGSLVGQSAPADPAAAQPLSSYVGTYQNPVYGPAEVREQGGGLVLAMGPGGKVVRELRHWDGNTYTFTLANENAEPGSISKVTFNGPTMTIEYYDDGTSDGVFTR